MKYLKIIFGMTLTIESVFIINEQTHKFIRNLSVQ